MDLDRPPDPPDTGDPDGQRDSESSSQQIVRKRPATDSSSDPSSKKTIVHPSTASPSIQSLYTHPSFSEGPKSYSDDDKGPFIVHVSRETSDPASGTTIRALKFGQFLHTHKITSIVKDGVKNVGRNKISVEFSAAQAANNFLKNPVLEMCKYKASVPTYNITRMGLIKGIPVDWSMEELVESLELPSGCGAVMKARRLNRKNIQEGSVSWIPTQSVVLTFRGQILPNRIFSFHTSLPVETYNLPTIQCLNCCRFGHIKSQCRSKPRCYKCSQEHTGDSCNITKENATCLHCSGRHFTTQKDCPEYLRQIKIKSDMSQDNISYMEASSRYPPVRRSYAEIAKEMFTPPPYIPTSSTQSPSSPNRSYRKTVTHTPRPRADLGKGYDKQAHQSIVDVSPSTLPNGCALNNHDSTSPSSSNNLLENLVQMVHSIVTTCSDIPLPSNVAVLVSQIYHTVNNGSNQLSSMEL
ncbi:unnamed protein product [Euphydryas editha]|uniref:Gag-like protein n=1 Tax=Euphydryas editha TaxID=104508 RepID=A0AAU9UMG0_EUPED|nr:unnamed protein product [Euphydryas editha]